MRCATFHHHLGTTTMTMTTEAGLSPAGDSGSTPPKLTVEDISDLPLADLLSEPGCPLCRLRAQTARSYLDSVLWESVNDGGFRDRLLAGRGFCPTHAREVLSLDRDQSGGSLGAAILYASVIRQRLEELHALPSEPNGRSRKVVSSARLPADCPVCEQVVISERNAVDGFLSRLDREDWRSSLARAELCLVDLLRMWVAAGERRRPPWSQVAAAQLKRIDDLRARLDGFTYHSSYDRRDQMTEGERRASDDASAFLGGTAPARRP
jgi:hypothetical protein